MKVRFQADADLRTAIMNATRRSEPLIDFQGADEAKLRGLSDNEVLKIAVEQKRLLVSHGQRTMPWHFSNFILHEASYGVLIVPQHLPTQQVADELVLIWLATAAEDWFNRIAYLPL